MQSNDVIFWTLPYGVDVQAKYCTQCALFTVNPSEDERQAVSGSAGIDAGATATTKHILFALDTGCLTSSKGCFSIAQLHPAIWQPRANGAVHCRIPNQDGVFQFAPPDKQ